eukprot:jgi/Mesvir1/1620/Mv05061-RA.1
MYLSSKGRKRKGADAAGSSTQLRGAKVARVTAAATAALPHAADMPSTSQATPIPEFQVLELHVGEWAPRRVAAAAFLPDMRVQGTIAHPGDRERYLASKRGEMDKGVRGGQLRGTSSRGSTSPSDGEDGTTGAFAARPFLEGAYVGDVGGDLWGPVGEDERIPVSMEILDFSGDSLGVFAVRRGVRPDLQEDEILHGWVFPSVRDLAGGLSMARLTRTPNTWLSWQGHAITSRPVQLGGELFLGLHLKGSQATDQSVLAELEGLGGRGLEYQANPHLYSRLLAAGFSARTVTLRHVRGWTWREPAADASVLVPQRSGWDAAVRVVLEAAGLTEAEATGQVVSVDV